MKNLTISKFHSNEFSGGIKAIDDCEIILKQMGFNVIPDFCPIDYKCMSYNSFKNVFYPKELDFLTDSLLIMQYPYFDISRFSYESILNYSRFLNCSTAALIHDINCARQYTDLKSISNYEHSFMSNMTDAIKEDEEIKILGMHDFIIVHSKQMGEWLKARGIKSKIIVKEAFDYLYDGPLPYKADKTCHSSEYTVCYAGSLAKYKCGFIYKLTDIKNVKFNLYGTGFSPKSYLKNSNVSYCGFFNYSDIITNIKGDFGLVWDGQLLEECSGPMGGYLKINYPHKISLYILASLPLIVPSSSAAADFVTKNKIGITIDNMYSLERALSSITLEDYNTLKNNTLKIREKLLNGCYLKKAVKDIYTSLNDNA